MVRGFALTSLSLVLLLAPLAHGQTPETAGVRSNDLDIRLSPIVTLKNHGCFRFRFNEFYRLDLGDAGASGVRVPLDSTSTNSGLGESRSTVESANLRFRYEPSLQIGEFMNVNARIDFLDNMTMGESPSWGALNAPFPFFARTQDPPSARLSGFRDSVTVKAAWADVRLFQQVHMLIGRMPERFGLGILRSDGSSPDSDFGDTVDAIAFHVRLPAARFKIQMEFPGEGTAAESPVRPYGPTHDPEQKDDISRWVFVFDSSPVEVEEFEGRLRTLAVRRRAAIDWGMYHSLTSQSISSDKTGGTMPAQCGTGVHETFGLAYDCYTLTPRSAFFWTPALWGRLLWHPRDDVRFRLEAEMVMVYGSVKYLQSFLDTGKGNTSKEFLEFGAALEADLSIGPDRFSLLTGVASGDGSSRGFGVLDQHQLVAPDDLKYSLYPGVAGNSRVTNFVFNRDYRVDSILFREVIGSITNAVYVKPAYSRLLWRSGPHELTGAASCLVGLAAYPEGTPGGTRPLGVEMGIGASYRLGSTLRVNADAAVLLPLSGLKRPGAVDDPKVAAALRTIMWVGF